MVKLFLVRHGEVENNIKHIFGGDSELTERGKEQAKEMAKYLKEIKFRVIYHSPRIRAVKTAEKIAEISSDAELVQIAELTEMNYGRLEGLSIDDVNERFPGLFKERAENKYYWKLEGENFEDIRKRRKAIRRSYRVHKNQYFV